MFFLGDRLVSELFWKLILRSLVFILMPSDALCAFLPG